MYALCHAGPRSATPTNLINDQFRPILTGLGFGFGDRDWPLIKMVRISPKQM